MTDFTRGPLQTLLQSKGLAKLLGQTPTVGIFTDDKRMILLAEVRGLNRQGDASLFAASPDMYAALEAFDDYALVKPDRGGSQGPKGLAWAKFVQLKDAALAKATETE